MTTAKDTPNRRFNMLYVSKSWKDRTVLEKLYFWKHFDKLVLTEVLPGTIDYHVADYEELLFKGNAIYKINL